MNLREARKHDSLGEFRIFEIIRFETLNDTEEELWLQLERLTNKFQAHDLLNKSIRKKNIVIKEISPILIEFIKQGKSYYKQAEKADLNISPLLFYYGMLNLVKAYILSRDPYVIIPKGKRKLLSKNLTHGISAGDNLKKDFSIYKESVNLKDNGILSHYYKLLMGSKIENLNINKKKIPVTNLLSYCLDISSEYIEVFKKRDNIMGVRIEIAKEKKTKKAWIRLIFDSVELRKRSLDHKNITQRNPGMNQYQRVKSSYRSSCVFEEKTTFSFTNEKNLQSQARKRIESLRLIFSESSDSAQEISYQLPLADSTDKNVILPEALNIYLAMYYFGSIVRYQPYVLKRIFPQKEGWVIQSFIRTCPKKFLRLITTSIFNNLFTFKEL